MADLPIPVSTGFTWTAAGAWGSFFALVGLLVRQWAPLRKIKQASDEKLIDTLTVRVDKLEAALETQRAHYEHKLDQLQAKYDGDQRVARHSLNNVRTQFRSLMLLLKRMPDPPPMLGAIISDIEAMVADHEKAEALEKGAQAGERFAAASNDYRGEMK